MRVGRGFESKLRAADAPAERKDLRLMREMFGKIAPRYDFITRVLSYGMDRRWKRQGLEKATLAQGAAVLDLACGTGDFSRLVLDKFPGSNVFAVDLTEPMLNQARGRGVRNVICANVLNLPFADASFDCVFIGYGLRNFPNLAASVAEIERVIRPGGQLATLDFFLPENRVLRRMYLAYLYAVGALWGFLLHGRPRLYTYIPDSLRSFISIQDFSRLLLRAGYARVEARPFIFGGIGLHWATKE
jgi:demethylmenaquinone methyltransferase / 2-methoxy-6-polyprenyl-1,4-benzoquinol methylase